MANEPDNGEDVATRSRGDDLELQCLNCGYVLRGLDVAKRCPECGTSIETSVKLFASPEVLARGFKLLGWSYASLFGWLLLFMAPPLFLLVAAAGAVLRVMGLYYLTRAGMRVMPGISTNTLNFAVLVKLEVLSVTGLAIYEHLHDWHFDMSGHLAAILWCMVAVVSASLLSAVAMARPLATRLNHKLILLQLRTTQRCVVIAYGVSIAAGLAVGAVMGINWRIILVGMFLHSVLAMLAAGHAIASLTHVAHAVNEEG